jgi:hypothetical protein
MKRFMIVLACAIAGLVPAAPAFAQTSTQDAYSGVAGQLNSGGGNDTAGGGNATPGGSVTPVQSSGDGTLPFTGFELILSALAGAGLVGGGIAMRRASRGGESTP